MPDVGWALLLLILGVCGTIALLIRYPQHMLQQAGADDDGDPPVRAHHPPPPAPNTPQLKPRHIWERALNNVPTEVPHLFIYGPSGSGKTVFAQHLLAHRAGQVMILDPKWQRAKWGGAPTATIGDDGEYRPIDAAAEQLLAEFRRRLSLHKQGEQAAPLTVLIDELPDLNDECPNVRKLFLSLLRMGRELNMRLIALSTGRGVEDLGLKGRGDARHNLVTLRLGRAAVEVRPDLARIARPAVLELRGQFVALDLREVTPTVAPLPLSQHWQPLEAAVLTLADQHPGETAVVPAESPGKALERAEIGVNEKLSEVEQAMIRGAILAGKGKTESLQALKGYSGRRHTLYAAAWEAARAEVGEVAS